MKGTYLQIVEGVNWAGW